MAQLTLQSGPAPAKVSRDINGALFVGLCLIWGTTWIATKAGITTVPPVFFAATRFITAGAVLLVWQWARGEPARILRADRPRVVAVSALMITLCYGPLFWGMLYVNSGTAAVLEMASTPVALLCFALMLGEERFDLRRAVAIALGVVGLVILFGPTAFGSHLTGTDRSLELAGTAAVVLAAVTYSWGSVLARPLLRRYPATLIAGITTFVGGWALLATSLAVEPGARDAMGGAWGVSAWAGWLFLVVFGSLTGYTIYMRLLRDWSASLAGTYAFVSPVIAVILGMVVFGEASSPVQFIGMGVMLYAAWLARTE